MNYLKPIKFRGRNIDTGEFVYGYLIQHFINSRVAKAIIYWNLVMHEVDPDSVAQLVGYDKDGNEVYEGDVMTTEDGKPFIVVLKPQGCVFHEEKALDEQIKW